MIEKNVTEIYMKEICLVPLLTAEEEKALALKSFNGDKKAREKLINANLRFVVKIAGKYKNSGLDMEDLINEGNEGLIIAADKFNPNNNTKFTTYAVWWITATIQKAIRETSKGIKFPSYKYEEMKEDKWIISSLDKAVGTDDDATIGDLLSDDRYVSPDEALYAEMEKDQVCYAMKFLSPKEKQIIALRYGLTGDKPKSLSQVGEIMNLTKERIRQIEKQSCAKMRMRLETECSYSIAA